MKATLVFAVSVVVVALVAGAFLVTTQPGATTSSTSQSSTTTVQTSGSYTSTTSSAQGLELRLSVNASSKGSNATVFISADEFNALATANNVSQGKAWALQGLSLGECGNTIYPFGVALYSGTYTAANVSQATPLQIHPLVPCPLFIRLITRYAFQPGSDLAVVLPSGPNATATRMSANVTATEVYATGGVLSSPTPLGPGTYTVAAGDEWGTVVLTHFTIGSGGASSTSTEASSTGTLEANFSIGPTQPVCSVNATVGPAPSSYSSIAAVVTPSPSGQASTFPISWTSNGCEVSGTLQASLAPGSYSLSLSSCTYMGCSSALPRSFVVVAGQSTSVNVSIDTGIR